MKSELRSDLLQQIHKASNVQKKEWSLHIQKKLSLVLADQKGYWGAFQPLADEPQLDWAEVSKNIQWCFPQTQEHDLQFRYGAGSHLRSALGVNEPVDGVEVSKDELQGVIVPGIGFGQDGYRLGRGKGFYDRTLASFSGKKVGVCFGLSFKPQMPRESHDVLFQKIITENTVYQVDHPEGDIKWN